MKFQQNLEYDDSLGGLRRRSRTGDPKEVSETKNSKKGLRQGEVLSTNKKSAQRSCSNKRFKTKKPKNGGGV